MASPESILQARSRVVLVTGASTGIGLALARRLLARADLRVVLTARASSLPRFAAEGIVESDRCRLRALDVTSSDDRQRVVEEAEADWGGIDVLVNNAGVAFRSVGEQIEADELRRQLDVNFLGPMELARLCLPSMRRKRAGRIVNVSSVSGMMAMPTMGAYSASKFALEGASESLWYEMRPWGVHVTLVQPGFIHSDSFENVVVSRAARSAMDNPADPYHAVYSSMAPFVATLMGRTLATPDSVARRVIAVIDHPRPKLRVSATLDARFFYLLRRWLPRFVYHHLLFLALPSVRRWGPGAPPPALEDCD